MTTVSDATPVLVDRSGYSYPLTDRRWRGDDGTPLAVSPLPGLGPDGIIAGERSLWRYQAALPVDHQRDATLPEADPVDGALTSRILEAVADVQVPPQPQPLVDPSTVDPEAVVGRYVQDTAEYRFHQQDGQLLIGSCHHPNHPPERTPPYGEPPRGRMVASDEHRAVMS
jgi:hypothetical protein